MRPQLAPVAAPLPLPVPAEQAAPYRQPCVTCAQNRLTRHAAPPCSTPSEDWDLPDADQVTRNNAGIVDNGTSQKVGRAQRLTQSEERLRMLCPVATVSPPPPAGLLQLTAAEIEVMRAEGKSGQEIIEALTANSTTFQAKTEFSQEKYK